MESRLEALSLALKEMGVPLSIAGIDKRKTIQKAIYLGQRAGANLGYRYGWYLKGPYSPALARDYYALAQQPSKTQRKLNPRVAQRLRSIQALLRPPKDSKLRMADWAELVASVDFLKRESNLSEEKVREIIERQKPRLARHLSAAIKAVESIEAR